MRILILFHALLSSFHGLFYDGSPDSSCYGDKVFNDKIKTVQLSRKGWNLSFPIIKLDTDEKLVLGFDLLDNHAETYYYTFIHCDKDWKKSDISTSDYMQGFFDNPIDDYKQSFNTTVNYIHYNLEFPNDRVQLTISGNYILLVYPSDEPDNPVLTLRFVVTEDASNIDITVHRPQLTTGDNARQQVDFDVKLKGVYPSDPYRDIYSFVLQNGRWNNAKKNLKPDYVRGIELKYGPLSDKNIFMGGNEFRYFDIKDLKYVSEFIERIDYVSPYYNVFLKPSENREFQPYYYWQDFNGKYYIANRQGKDPDTDSDYFLVYFTLPSNYLIAGGKMYVSGNLNNWSFDKNNLMTFNLQKKQYECTMLLKQGWYNYEYVFLKDGDSEGVASLFEGSHYETENDYMIIVYYRNPSDRYDRVVGTATLNTLNKIAY